MAAGYQLMPFAALLLATAVTLLVATPAVPAVAAAAADKYSGRMVIIRAPGARVVVSAGGAALNSWQQQRQRQRRLVEDEVAPEFGGLLGAANGGDGISAGALDKDKGICLPNAQCAARGPGGSNTRPCTFKDHCPHTPTAAGAGHARAVHV